MVATGFSALSKAGGSLPHRPELRGIARGVYLFEDLLKESSGQEVTLAVKAHSVRMGTATKPRLPPATLAFGLKRPSFQPSSMRFLWKTTRTLPYPFLR